MPDLAIIIVSWNVRDLLRDCLRGVAASLAGSSISYGVIVVDNASTDGTSAMVCNTFPDARLIETDRNQGFAAANNVALRTILDEDQHRYIMLLNPDTVPQTDALAALVRYLDAHADMVAVGPQLRYGDGSVQSSRRRFPTMATFFWESTPLERLWPRNPWARRYRYDDTPDNVEQRVGWLVGAALLVRTSAIAEAGLLDERFFMYSEELEWQMRLQKAKGKRQKEESSRSFFPFPFSLLDMVHRYFTVYAGACGPEHRFSFWRRSRQKKKEKPMIVAGEARHRSQTAKHKAVLPNLVLPSNDLLCSRIAYLPSAVITHYEGRSSEQALAGRHINFQQSKLRLACMLYGNAFALALRLFLLSCYTWNLAVETAKLTLGHRRDLRRQRIGVYAQVLRKLVVLG